MSQSSPLAEHHGPPRNLDPLVFVAVWLILFVYGCIAAPVPAVNEPHYLCKARHYWQPDWCQNDFFLQSTNAHTVFFATIGSLTQWLSLNQTAWTGRVIALIILTIGWCRLMEELSTNRWFPLQTCSIFLAFQACGNFSGEWLVGGVEGKVLSYGLLFAALGEALRGRRFVAGVATGLAIAFHPVVGLWGVLAFLGAMVWSYLVRDKSEQINPGQDTSPPALRRWPAGLCTSTGINAILPSLVAMVLCALPGLLPVFHLLTEPVLPETASAANYIQVYYRLAHHLDPMLFPQRAYLCYAALTLVWIVTIFIGPRTPSYRVLHRVVGFAILFALAGVLIGWGPRPAANMPYFFERARLLKFYPFRLADLALPLAVAIGLANAWPFRSPSRRQTLAFSIVLACALLRAPANVESNVYSSTLRHDWIDACHWIEQNLPADAVVQAPHNGWAFKWFAQRAEYVAYKDCPQNSAGIVEWNRRLNFLKRWFEDHYRDRFYSADELRSFRRETGITHLLTDRLGPLELEPTYRNATFQVYDLTTLD